MCVVSEALCSGTPETPEARKENIGSKLILNGGGGGGSVLG